MVLDRLAEKFGVQFHIAKWQAEIATRNGVHFCKPTSFMNLSGQPVAAVSHFYKVPANEILIVLDDAALPLGRLRIRSTGSSGGHNGLQSVIENLGTQDVPRLRVGIGAADGKEMTDHVLGRFSQDEQPVLDNALQRAVEAVESAMAHGLEAAMNFYNKPETT
jgi:PTH1 family peptidyl-tRNA hydrolase